MIEIEGPASGAFEPEETALAQPERDQVLRSGVDVIIDRDTPASSTPCAWWQPPRRGKNEG